MQISTISQEQLLLTLTEYREVLHGSAAQEPWYTVVILQKEVFGTDDPAEVGEKVKRLGYNERDCCSTEGERLLHIFFLCRHLPFIWKQHRTVLGTAW